MCPPSWFKPRSHFAGGGEVDMLWSIRYKKGFTIKQASILLLKQVHLFRYLKHKAIYKELMSFICITSLIVIKIWHIYIYKLWVILWYFDPLFIFLSLQFMNELTTKCIIMIINVIRIDRICCLVLCKFINNRDERIMFFLAM